ncbi:ORF6N domain-containing protein [Aquimarina sp. RZ0]|uniref:ORF6N domain-containing protein n=1 Tax=Aquimarina sp. RZ0 TaxID=2607730 RepID=UPI0011F1F9A2|nr:ORF6N domain-containing protein [Aquimarina sp. RZ0]KAA1241013.1 ORF6N domain-containing protein [Aquimarina sp. RZ0]
MSKEISIPDEIITNKIYLIRDQKVMLDRDLAELYGVETKRLKEAVRRNKERFPEDFMFEMTKEEFQNWRTQFATSKSDQRGLRYAPFCFTEQGVTMLSCVLNSKKAIEVNIKIIRVFTKLRQMLTENLNLQLDIEEIKKKLTNHSKNIELVFDYLDELNQKLDTQKAKNRNKIGYKK